jgi:peptidoglycan/xylan/chitin deacetylase (PgdA/CDA1 family)
MRLPILTFHSLDDRSVATAFPPRLFRQGMAGLDDAGYRTVTLTEIVGCLSRGHPFPERAFAITFDDGDRSVYETALPVLERHGMTATVFPVIGPFFEGRRLITGDEMREMGRRGISFGAHTLTHPDLTRLPPDRAEAEVRGSKSALEDQVGAPVDSFCYPYGRYNPAVRELVSRHFTCALTDRLGFVTCRSDPHALERIDTYYVRSEPLFDLMRTGLFPLYVRARGIPRRLRRALAPAGTGT